MSHTYVCTYNFLLHLALSPTLSLRNNQVCTFHWAIPFSPPTLFLIIFVHIAVWHIEGLCLGGLRISWYLVVLAALRVVSLGLPHILGLEGILLLSILFECFLSGWWNCFWCSPSQSSSAFLQIGQFGPHPHHSGFGVSTGFCWSGSWGSIFTGSLGFVVVTVLFAGGMGYSFLSSKWLPDIFPASGQGVLA